MPEPAHTRHDAATRLDATLTAARERWILVAILAVALLVRVVFVLEMRASPYFEDPALDQGFFAAWGRRVAGGEWWPSGVCERPPLYAWFLGLGLKLGDGSLLAPRLVQSLVGTASVFLVWKLARDTTSRAAALVAALLCAVAWPLVYYDGEIVREPLAIATSLGALLLVVRWSRGDGFGRAALAGLAFGVSALLRPQVLVVAGALAVWIVATRRARVVTALVFLAACAVPIAPVTLHNLRASGDLVLISPEGGQALWIGNHPGADGLTAVAPGTRRGFEEQQVDARAAAERAAGRPLAASEVSRWYRDRAIEWVRRSPLDALRLYGRKLALLVSGAELGGNPEEPRFLAERFAPLVWVLPVGFTALAVLAGAAWTAVRRRAGVIAPLLVFLGAYAATVLLVVVSARHRLPLVPILAVLAGAGALEIACALADRAWRRLALALALGTLALVATRVQTVPLDASRANGLYFLATAAARSGDAAGAVRTLDEAIALRPDFAYLHAARGAALQALGRSAEARDAYARAVELAPTDVAALDALGELELGANHLDAARALAERSIAAAPELPRGLYVRGRARFYAGDLDGAAEDFRAALARAPDSFQYAYSLAAALESRHDLAGAYEARKVAAAHADAIADALRRENWTALARLARLLGRPEESRDWERRAAEPTAAPPGRAR